MKRVFLILSATLLVAVSIICIIACSNSNPPKDLPESNGSYETTNIDLTQLSSTMIYSEVYNMVYTPENYIGKIVKIYGIYSVYYSKQTGLYYPAVIIPDATACCSQGIEFVLKDKEYPNGYPKEGTKITVIGKFSTYIEYGQTYCHLIDAEIL